MKPFISLCMIVKNEEKVLERCLSSVVNLVDEIIIIDTGSTDATKEIAANFTSDIYDFEWINDFSAARNFAASKATGEWLLVLDADEYVDEENFKSFIQELKEDQNELDAYTVKIINFAGNFGENLLQNFHDRIYKNNSEIVFYRKIHEQFKHIKDKQLKIKQSSLLIFHSGYLNQVVSEKDKRSRNNNLLDDEMNEGSNKAFDYFNYGNEYASEGNYEKALDCYLKAYKGKTDFRLIWVSTTLVQIIVCLMQLKKYNDALNVIKDAESIYSSSAEILFLKGEIFFLRGQLEDAKQAFLQIVDNQQKYNHIILRPDFKDQKPHMRLGEIYLYQEDYNKAIYHFTSVLNINKYSEESIKKVIYILNKFHSKDEITNFLYTKELVNQKNVKSYVNASFEVGNPKLALELLNGYIEESRMLFEIALLKNFCIENDGSIEEFEGILNSQVLGKLLETNWINIIDLVLLRKHAEKNNALVLLEHFNQVHEYKILNDFVDGQININELDGNLIISALQTFLLYKKYSLLDSLLENIEMTDKEIILKVAGVLYAYGYKAEALQLYEMLDWNDFSIQDFINIVKALLETDNKEDAIKVAQYAKATFTNDFRFYQYILENTTDLNLFRITMEEARGLFPNSLSIEKLDK